MRSAGLLALLMLLVSAPGAGAANIEVVGNVLSVEVPRKASEQGVTPGASVDLLPGGGAIVGFYGNNLVQQELSTGAGCQPVSPGNAAGGPPFSGSAAFAATCNLSGVVGVRGRLGSSTHAQLWRSSLNLPTKITTVTGTNTTNQDTGDTIITGPSGDTIDAGGGADTIDPGGAPYKGQEAVPGITGEFQDPGRNLVNAGAGADKIELSFGTGRDTVSGGAGVDGVTYVSRFGTVGFPGQRGVDVSLNDLADDGDPAIDQPDAASAGEGDNVKADVENVTGTRRADVLTGNVNINRLEGREGADTLTGLSSPDVLLAREPGLAGLRDTLSCGSPLPSVAPQTFMGATIGSTSPGDSVDIDLLDVAPRDCEIVTQGPVREGPNVAVASKAARAPRGRLRVRLRCPRAAGRTCSGTIRLAARSGRSGPRARFSIPRGRAGTATVAPPAGSALPGRGRRFTVRLLALERGRHGRVTTVAFARVGS